jgi:hypothetical protein
MLPKKSEEHLAKPGASAISLQRKAEARYYAMLEQPTTGRD